MAGSGPGVAKRIAGKPELVEDGFAASSCRPADWRIPRRPGYADLRDDPGPGNRFAVARFAPKVERELFDGDADRPRLFDELTTADPGFGRISPRAYDSPSHAYRRGRRYLSTTCRGQGEIRAQGPSDSIESANDRHGHLDHRRRRLNGRTPPPSSAEYGTKLPSSVIAVMNRGSARSAAASLAAFYHGYDTGHPDGTSTTSDKLDLDLDLPPRLLRITHAPHGGQTPPGTTDACSEQRLNSATAPRRSRFSESAAMRNWSGWSKFNADNASGVGDSSDELMCDGIDCHRCRYARLVAVSGTTRSGASNIFAHGAPDHKTVVTAGSARSGRSITWERRRLRL